MMLSGRMLRRSLSSDATITDLTLPPAVLQDITARTLLAAITARVQPYMPQQVGDVSLCSVLVFNTDSHSALKKVANHFASAARAGTGPWSVHGRCMMHMFFSALASTVAPLGLANPMFCSTILLRKGANMRNLRLGVRKLIAAKLRIVYRKPPDHNRHNSAVVRLLDLLDTDHFCNDNDIWPPTPLVDLAGVVIVCVAGQGRQRRGKGRSSWCVCLQTVPTLFHQQLVARCSVL